jgi:hypothetical protein
MRPFVTHYQSKEGDDWQPFRPHDLIGRELGRVHALKLSDDSEWDTYNGWRTRALDGPWAQEEIDDEEDDREIKIEAITVASLERLLLILRQTIGKSGGGTNLNIHDKDNQLHFAFEGTMPHDQEDIP